MQNRLLRTAALIGALCAVSGCASQGPTAVPISPPEAQKPASISVARTFSLRVSSEHTVRADHYEVPPDYDNNITLHPYTSGLGPCPHGGPGKVNCSSEMVPASHYNH